MSAIFVYDDYRDLIKDLIQNKKKKTKTFSYSVLASKVNTSKSYFKLVSDKKRHVSIDKISDFCAYFKLSKLETQYFYFLYLLNIVEDPEVKSLFKSIVEAFKYYKNKTDEFTSNFPIHDVDSYSSWIKMALLELSNIKNMPNDPFYIQNILGGEKILSLETIKKNIEELLELKFLILEDEKYLTNNGKNNVLEFIPYFPTKTSIFEAGLDRAQLAFKNSDRSDIHSPSRFHTFVAGLTEESQNKILILFEKLEKEILEIVHIDNNPNPDRVFLITNNFIKISKVQFNCGGANLKKPK